MLSPPEFSFHFKKMISGGDSFQNLQFQNYYY